MYAFSSLSLFTPPRRQIPILYTHRSMSDEAMETRARLCNISTGGTRARAHAGGSQHNNTPDTRALNNYVWGV